MPKLACTMRDNVAALVLQPSMFDQISKIHIQLFADPTIIGMTYEYVDSTAAWLHA